MFNKLWWGLVPSLFLAALAVSSIHCAGNSGRKIGECHEVADCDNLSWPGLASVPCDEADGHWECQNFSCVPVCDHACETVEECIGEWTEECSGHFACTGGLCEQVCDAQGCGDGMCSDAGGETKESCPADCDQPCAAPGDCFTGREWGAACEGRWDCQAQTCVEVCDYDSCGNGICDAAQGENADSCPRDCVEGCRVPGDCFLEQWSVICQGRWNCFVGECMEICDSSNCGDGICWGLNGENEDSCFLDCLGGPCQEPIDCLAHRWYDPDHQPCQGHWQCNPADPPGQLTTGACEAVCDPSGCGDGTCDTLNGETPVSCLVDCGSGYSCSRSEDCDSLTLPGGCTGDWICSSLICVPQCE
jgi:hypothetical protein